MCCAVLCCWCVCQSHLERGCLQGTTIAELQHDNRNMRQMQTEQQPQVPFSNTPVVEGMCVNLWLLGAHASCLAACSALSALPRLRQ